MIGSGIFVLPGLAFKIAGPSVVLAFFLAGVVVLPAALSQSEMATAMPEAGGTYLYIDRAMGPLMGTIAGFGVWFSLVFKASFALVGLSAYLEFFGFYSVFSRFSAVFGPLIFAGVDIVTGSARLSILFLTAFFLIGGALLAAVDVDQARASRTEWVLD